ncbi:MAG: S8 family serine peptidase [Candidatus Aminicenantes bacterium]|nr:S8 family serine peptidase [Candidatus Aminicenantes bacterium]
MKQKPVFLPTITLGLAAGFLLFLSFAVTARSQPKPLVKLSESALKENVLYDAWVEFKDKGALNKKQRQIILENLEKNFNPRALKRRKKKRTFPGLFDEKDFPLAGKYIEGVAKTGAKIRVKSRWLNGVTILTTKKQIQEIKNLPFVKKVGDFHEHKPRLKHDTPPKKRPSPKTTPGFYGRSDIQVRQLGLHKLHKAGYTGKGILVAVIDCGFDLSHSAFNNKKNPLRVTAQWDFVENDGDVTPRPGMHHTNYDHGTAVLGAIAAYSPGELVGTAYDADYILCNAEDGEIEYYLEERWFAAALEFAEARGADALTTSLVLYSGYTTRQADGRTAVMTKAMNIAVGNGLICLCGGGNAGHDQDAAVSHLNVPADSPDVISVGAIDVDGYIAPFSSDGPGSDGRIKPEVLALGVRTATVSPVDKKGYMEGYGTSMAAPVMAGAVACLLQTHPGWTVKEIRRALFFSGDYYRKHGKPDPLFIHGYGIPDVFLAARGAPSL